MIYEIEVEGRDVIWIQTNHTVTVADEADFGYCNEVDLGKFSYIPGKEKEEKVPGVDLIIK